MKTQKAITLRTGVVIDLSLKGTLCEVTGHGGEKRTLVIVGTFKAGWKDKLHFYVTSAEALREWNGDAMTIPGVGFPEADVRILEPSE